MRIGNKLSLLVTGLLAVLLLIMSAAAFALQRQGDQNASKFNEFGDIVLATESVQYAYLQQEYYFRDAVQPWASQATVELNREAFVEQRVLVEQNIDQLEALDEKGFLTDIIEELRSEHDQVSELQAGQLVVGQLSDPADLDRFERASEAFVSRTALPLERLRVETLQIEEDIHENAARASAVGFVLVAFFAAITGYIALLLIRSIVTPLRRLTATAQDVASRELPGRVDDIMVIETDFETPHLPEIESGTIKDELEDLADAMSRMQSSSVSLAADQRRNQLANGRTLVNLGRRNQSLLTRTLGYISELEHTEEDPQALEQLFRLDHLTTRIRRNAESMLVLAGAEQARMYNRPVHINDVIRASLSEIEDYSRVSNGSIDPVMVSGAVAADVAHLVAELLENATRFSPEDRPVYVHCKAWNDSYVLGIVDYGIGMNAGEISAANELIRTASRRRSPAELLGYHVVGRIADRQGMKVVLRPTDGGGLTAQVLLNPNWLLPADTAPAQVEPQVPEPVVEKPVEAQVPNVDVATVGAPATAGHTVQPREVPMRNVPEPREPVATPSNVSRFPTPPERNIDENGLPRRRVRGAQLPDLGEDHEEVARRHNPQVVKSQLSSLQNSVARARQNDPTKDN